MTILGCLVTTGKRKPCPWCPVVHRQQAGLACHVPFPFVSWTPCPQPTVPILSVPDPTFWGLPTSFKQHPYDLASSPTELGKAMPCEFHIPESLRPQAACLPVHPPSVSPHHLIQGTSLSCPGDDDSPGLLMPILGTRESYSCSTAESHVLSPSTLSDFLPL